MTLLGTQVYAIKWTPKSGFYDDFPTFPATSTSSRLYLDFGNCVSGEKAKINRVRLYKNLADIPNN